MLSIKDLSVEIAGSSILNRVSLQVQAGETVGLIGPNGSGKTTLFNCISGFIAAQSGSISFKGKELLGLEPDRRALAGIGRVFQNSGVFRDMTVLENIIIAIEGRSSIWGSFFPWSAKSNSIQEQARGYLRQINLEAKASEKAASLSGGQLRLLEIVRTLAFGADLFLLDEPTAGVSPKMKDDVAAQIRALQQQGKTVFIIEHDISFIELFCQRIIVLDIGQVVIDDQADKVRQDSRLHEIYFGSGESPTKADKKAVGKK